MLLFCLVGSYVIFLYADEFAESKALCNSWEVHQMGRALRSYNPVKVTVEPWRGRHHVYAVFEIPANLYPIGILKVHIEGLGDVCGSITEVYFDETPVSGVVPAPGHYLIRANLRSRVTLWVASRFFFSELKDEAIWMLY